VISEHADGVHLPESSPLLVPYLTRMLVTEKAADYAQLALDITESMHAADLHPVTPGVPVFLAPPVRVGDLTLATFRSRVAGIQLRPPFPDPSWANPRTMPSRPFAEFSTALMAPRRHAARHTWWRLPPSTASSAHTPPRSAPPDTSSTG
jgi:hypothetical protein